MVLCRRDLHLRRHGRADRRLRRPYGGRKLYRRAGPRLHEADAAAAGLLEEIRRIERRQSVCCLQKAADRRDQRPAYRGPSEGRKTERPGREIREPRVPAPQRRQREISERRDDLSGESAEVGVRRRALLRHPGEHGFHSDLHLRERRRRSGACALQEAVN